jgi:hypothetical protein
MSTDYSQKDLTEDEVRNVILKFKVATVEDFSLEGKWKNAHVCIVQSYNQQPQSVSVVI